jgi:putative transposase
VGAAPLKKILEDRNPQLAIPAASTIGAIVEREGLTRHRPKRRRVEPYRQPFARSRRPTTNGPATSRAGCGPRDGERIDPLTISDSLSRYLLRCQAVDKTDTARVQAVFEAAFREFGMPRAVRSDNGPPFASCAVAGLSRLSVWWIKLGIVPQRIEAGHPEQNGRHERMHRTLKEAAASPPKANRRMQQRAFDQFRREYNEVRPHQALAMETPESVYRSSPRPFPGRVPEPEYDTTMKVRHVFKHGQFFFNQHDVFLSKVLSMASASACCRSTTVTCAFTWPGIRSPGWIPRPCRWKSSGRRIGPVRLKPVERRKSPKAGIPTFPQARLRRADES